MGVWKKIKKGVKGAIKKTSRGTMNLMTRPDKWTSNVGRDIRKGYQKYDRWNENDNPIYGRRRSLSRLADLTGKSMERIGEHTVHPRRSLNRMMTPDIPEMEAAVPDQVPSQESAAAKAARRRRRKARSLLQSSRQGNTMLGL